MRESPKLQGCPSSESHPYSLEFDLPDPAALERDWNYTDRADRLYRVGHGLLSRGFFEGAVGLFDRAIRYDQRHYMAYVGRSEGLVMLGRFAEAERMLQEASNRYGRNCALGAALGHVYLHLDHSDEAFKCTDIATRNDPGSAYAWIIAGEARLSLKGGDRFADRCFQQALEAREFWPRADLRIALAWLEWGPRDRATVELEKILKREPKLPLAWVLLGDAHRVCGRWRAARVCYRRALALSPGLDSVRRALSWSAGVRNVWTGLRMTVKRALAR
jgi:Flp pilus assembly protein TadD